MREIDLQIPRGAIFSEDRKYRYVLWRSWSPNRPPLLFIGLNPSTANEISDDATIIRNMARSAQNGFGSLLMANLYAYVSTNPACLLKDGQGVGAENDDYLHQVIKMAGRVVCGWGSFHEVKKRADIVLRMISEPYCLGKNADGQPKHPLYSSYDIPMTKY